MKTYQPPQTSVTTLVTEQPLLSSSNFLLEDEYADGEALSQKKKDIWDTESWLKD